jgi:hypothetical protein
MVCVKNGSVEILELGGVTVYPKAVISVLKRKYGTAVSSRVWWRQFRELVVRCLVYNVERAVKLGVALLDRLWFHLLYSLQWRISTEPIVYNCDSNRSSYVKTTAEGSFLHSSFLHKGSSAKDQTALAGGGL